jgi:hypothetical protein
LGVSGYDETEIWTLKKNKKIKRKNKKRKEKKKRTLLLAKEIVVFRKNE